MLCPNVDIFDFAVLGAKFLPIVKKKAGPAEYSALVV
jgi:hypothetical protein